MSRIKRSKKIDRTLDESLLVLVGQLFQTLSFSLREEQGGENASQHEEGEDFEACSKWILDMTSPVVERGESIFKRTYG